MHKYLIYIVISLTLVVCGLSYAQDTPADEGWREMIIGGVVCYRMPDEVMRELGFDVPDLPDDQNAALVFFEAADQFEAYDGGWEILIEAGKRPWKADEFPALDDWLNDNEQAFDLLDKALAMDECYFPVLMRQPGDTLIVQKMMPALSISRAIARALAARANLHAGEGRLAQSMDDFMRTIELGILISREYSLISGLVGYAIIYTAIEGMDSILQGDLLGGEKLRELQERMAAMRPYLPDPVTGIKGEEISNLNMFDEIMYGDLTILEHVAGYVREDGPAFFENFRGGRAYRVLIPDRTMRADFVDFYHSLIEYARQPFWETGDTDHLLRDLKPYNILAHVYLPALSRTLESYAELFAYYDGVTQAIALKIYKADHGEYPDELDALAPNYLDELPPDPFTGKAFLYSIEEDGFIIYSVGRNREDDGGRTWEDIPEGDDIVVRIRKN